jgi:hypothetical protein
MTRLKWKLVLVRLEIVVILTQVRRIVYAKCTIGSEIVLIRPMELLGVVGRVKSRFSPLGDDVSVSGK